ncbi:stage V sporulation protein D [bacterium]|nr:stage V sporulation protein D [bacterium]
MNKRHITFFFIIIIISLAIISRLGYLQLYKNEFFKEKSNNQLKRIIKLYPNRGSIFDRNLKPLALTEPSYQIYAIPNDIENKWVLAKKIAPILNKDRKDISDKLYASKAPFLWLKRHASESTMKTLKALNLKGLGFIKTEKRVYPNNQLASHMMGFVGIDNQGLSGIEYRYDKQLKGSSGKIILDGDPRGTQLVSGKKIKIPPNDGQSIITTIDSSIQFIAEKFLEKAVKKHKAEAGQAIIMDPKTGDILAMAIVPTFNPNTWQSSKTSDRRIRPITDVFEPGSIFKIITLASVLEEDIVSSKTTIHVPETYKLFNKVIKEAHARKENESSNKTVSEIIEQSLNVGTTLLAIKLGKERFYKYIKEFGFGEKTHIQLPGESKGLLSPPQKWSGLDIATHSFGQGIATTGLQLTAAMSIIANNGIYIKPRIIKYFQSKDQSTLKGIPIQKKERIISEQTAYEVKKTLFNVVERGTAKNIKIKGYTLAGKTGTAQKAKTKGLGYEKGNYIASFLGFFPVEDPKIVMLVSIDSPQKGYYGSTVAGPVFKECAKFIIDYYNIPPNTLTTTLRQGISKVNSY